MSTVRVSWSGELTPEQGEILSDAFNVMGLYSVLERCELTEDERHKIQSEIDELENKYKEILGE